MCSPGGPAYHFFDSDPCFIRGSRLFFFSLLSGTSVRSVAKRQARCSVPHFPAKPKVRPLPTELQIGNLLPARSMAHTVRPIFPMLEQS